MSAKQRITQIASDVTDLETLATLINNLPAIKAAGLAARQEVALTQDQEAKHSAALATIAKSDALLAQLKSREDALISANSDHEGNVQEFSAQISDFAIHVKATSEDMAAQQAALTNAIATHEEVKKQFATQSAVADAAMRRREQEVQKKEDGLKRITEAQLLEDARLTQARNAINQKAQRLAQAIEG